MNRELNSCPACDNQGYCRSYVVRNYPYYLCDSCGTLYLRDRNSVAGPEDTQYDTGYFRESLKENMSGYMDYEKQSQPLRMNFRSLLNRITPYLSTATSTSLLDVGCAYGFFLDEARKIGMTVHGLDISKSAIQWMEEHLEIKGTVGLSSHAPEGPFDLITAIEVIEHTPDPSLFIDDLHGRLKKGGILVIVTGAGDSTTARLLGKRWWYLNPPDHCAVFSRIALRTLITDKGFSILEHTLLPFHWVGLNNMMLKVARILESVPLGRIASKLPALVVPVVHYSTQLLIAEKR